jgi:hypothetical protein
MSGPTNEKELIEAHRRAEARKATEEALSAEDKAFLKALQNRWFPLGKTEDFQIVKKIFIESRGQG